MSEGFSPRFSAEEMAAIRRSLRDEARFGTDLMSLLKRVAKRIPFAEDLLAAYFCTRDPATPRLVRPPRPGSNHARTSARSRSDTAPGAG